ncbi:MAG: MipA/OmpV family protein [Roseibium sp.]|uniref:MipA/OmpV family protein n=1 Tax=Roseibium sp. TaxID=1936156 RepID=UPI00260D523B|nr:MipA/OmpV family protein [Roseibium sp.]MCV0425813.1 MipA/OmpV family protein [Roseibium sp.]
MKPKSMRAGAIGATCLIVSKALLATSFLLPIIVRSHAQEPPEKPVLGKPGIRFELGAFGAVAPSYEGSRRYTAYPLPVVRFHSLRFSNGFELGGGDGTGFSIYPSLGYLGERSTKNDPALQGLPDVDHSIELGTGVSYRYRNTRAFVDLRYGAIGHNGFVGVTGVDLIMHPEENLTFTLGPRISFASRQYMETYFSVSPESSTSSGLHRFSASGGIKSAGLAASLKYQISDAWAVEGRAGWDRLIGDAGASPITALGDKNQFTFGIGFTRKFQFGY